MKMNRELRSGYSVPSQGWAGESEHQEGPTGALGLVWGNLSVGSGIELEEGEVEGVHLLVSGEICRGSHSSGWY